MNVIPKSSALALTQVRAAEDFLLSFPQVSIETEQHLHAGVYARTAYLDAGTYMTGAEIKIPTLLILTGDMTLHTGESFLRFSGTNIIEAEAGRKTFFEAHADSSITMIFKSDAESFEEAEEQFTDEANRLQTRSVYVG